MKVNEYIRVAAIVQNSHGELLVMRHGGGKNGFWTCPGGLLHVGESLSYALRRSVLTETGLHIRIADVACVGEVTLAQTDRRRVEVYFYAELADNNPRALQPESQRLAWLRIAERTHQFLPAPVLAAIRHSAHGEYLGNMTDTIHPLPARQIR